MELNVLQSDDPLPVEPNSPRFPGSEKKRRRARQKEKKGKTDGMWLARIYLCQKIAGAFSGRIIVDFSTRLRYKRAYNEPTR